MNSPAPAKSGEERRVAARKPLSAQASVHVGGQVVSVRTTDVSVGGLSIVAQANPPAGLEMGIEFRLPPRGGEAALIRCRVKVMHSVFSSQASGFKVGLSFLNIDPAMLKAVQQYVG